MVGPETRDFHRRLYSGCGRSRLWRGLAVAAALALAGGGCSMSGQFDTVVQEVEVESLAEWETMRVKLFELAAFRDSMASMQELVVLGRNELWTVEAEG